MKSISFLLFVALLALAASGQDCEARKSWADIAKAADAPPTSVSSSKPQATSGRQPQKAKELEHTGGWYLSLPAGATKYTVRNVYDGDTLFLMGGRGVRFLGIDTPELKEQQPYAQEAKAYSRALCHKKDVYLTFDDFGDKEDKYERLLAFVWVEAEGGGYINVNEGLVAAGLATVYLPRKDARLPNMKRMLQLQKEARQAKRGIWTNFQDYNVVVTPFGAAFHLRSCKHVARSNRLREIKASEGSDQGLHPCRTCLADK